MYNYEKRKSEGKPVANSVHIFERDVYRAANRYLHVNVPNSATRRYSKNGIIISVNIAANDPVPTRAEGGTHVSNTPHLSSSLKHSFSIVVFSTPEISQFYK